MSSLFEMTEIEKFQIGFKDLELLRDMQRDFAIWKS